MAAGCAPCAAAAKRRAAAAQTATRTMPDGSTLVTATRAAPVKRYEVRDDTGKVLGNSGSPVKAAELAAEHPGAKIFGV